jgi:hypothetical protein
MARSPGRAAGKGAILETVERRLSRQFARWAARRLASRWRHLRDSGVADTPLSARATLEMAEIIQFQANDAIDVLDPESDWDARRSFLQAIFEGDEAF